MLARPVGIAALVSRCLAGGFSPALILLIVRRAEQTRPGQRRIGAPRCWLWGDPAVGCIWAFSETREAAASLTVSADIYLAFFSVLLIWGWVELAFLIWGHHRTLAGACPKSLQGWARFRRAWQTVSHHEALLLWAWLSWLSSRLMLRTAWFLGVFHTFCRAHFGQTQFVFWRAAHQS